MEIKTRSFSHRFTGAMQKLQSGGRSKQSFIFPTVPLPVINAVTQSPCTTSQISLGSFNQGTLHKEHGTLHERSTNDKICTNEMATISYTVIGFCDKLYKVRFMEIKDWSHSHTKDQSGHTKAAIRDGYPN